MAVRVKITGVGAFVPEDGSSVARPFQHGATPVVADDVAEQLIADGVAEFADEGSGSPGPAGGTPDGDRVTGDYASATAERLQAEVDARTAEGRTIEVTGTGQGGNVLKGDLVAALDADDDTGH